MSFGIGLLEFEVAVYSVNVVPRLSSLGLRAAFIPNTISSAAVNSCCFLGVVLLTQGYCRQWVSPLVVVAIYLAMVIFCV